MPIHPPEPFRIKMVEPINLIDREERQKALIRSGFNLFALNAEDVFMRHGIRYIIISCVKTGGLSRN